jgi:predicted ATP-grasp superfamily ATP-dependent carboligase
MQQSILVTDGNERAALAAARSLVASGFGVSVTAATRYSLAGAARGVTPRRVTVSPLGDPAAYARAIGRSAAELGASVVLPVTDESVQAILDQRSQLPPNVIVPLPDLSAYNVASDKLRLLDLAREAGFAVPETIVAQSPGTPIPSSLFPAVVKPHRSVIGAPGVRHKVGVTFVADGPACARALAALPPEAFPVLVQRRIAGAGEGLFLLRWDGEVVAAFAHRRIRENPPAGGQSVYRESIPLDPSLLEPGVRLLEALDWRGVAMIETRRESASGRPVIMEVNGRLWGSLQLAIDAGVDFPTLLVQCALAEGEMTPGPVRGYRAGVRSRWLWGDVDHLYVRLRRSAAALHLDDGAPSRLAALADFLRVWRREDRLEVWRANDPGPFFVETLRRFGVLR